MKNPAIVVSAATILFLGIAVIWLKIEMSKYKHWFQENSSYKKSKKYAKIERKYKACKDCFVLCIVILGVMCFILTIVTAIAKTLYLNTESVDVIKNEKDPAIYDVDQETDTIIEYENEKEKGFFMDLKKQKPATQITEEAILFYYEQISKEISLFGVGIDPALCQENEVAVDYSRLTELSNIIKSYDNPSKVPIEIYEEEYEIRKGAYSKEPSSENAYQTGRAADDIFHILYLQCGESHLEKKERVDADDIYFYASQAILYYRESLKNSKTEETRNDIIFKMGLIFQKLYLLSDLLEEDILQSSESNRIHFLLLANAFFELCKNYDTEDNTCKAQFAFYFGCNLYEAGFLAETEFKRTLWEKAIDYLENYIESKEGKTSEEKNVDQIEDSRYRIKIITQNMDGIE